MCTINKYVDEPLWLVALHGLLGLAHFSKRGESHTYLVTCHSQMDLICNLDNYNTFPYQ